MKRKIFYSLTAMALVLIFTMGNICVADNVGNLKDKKSNVEKNIENKKSEMNKMKKQSSSLTDEIKGLDEKVTKATDELEKVEKELEGLNKEIKETKKEIEAAEKRMNEKQEEFNSRLRVMYKKGNVGYLEVLLSSVSIGDFLARKDMVQAVVNYDVDLLEYIKEQKDIVDKKEAELKSQKSSVEVAKEKAKEKKEELVAATSTKEAAMKELEKDIETIEKEYAELEKESEQISAEISSKQMAAATPSPSRGTSNRTTGGNNRGNNNVASNKPNNNTPAPTPPSGGGALAWPSGGPITSPYGPRWGSFHSGIDIGIPVGTPVHAADSGTVIIAKTGYNGGYGNYLVVDHGGGISTLYAHNSALLVGVGSKVSRGQMITRSGNSGRSTGPHLHFEVRVNGGHVNPMRYLR